MMKSAGVFLGGLTSVLACNLMLVGVCSSASPATLPSAPSVPPPTPAPVVRIAVRSEPAPSEPLPWGTFIWGCGGRISIDPEGAVALPICLSRAR